MRCLSNGLSHFGGMAYQYCDDPLLILPDPNPTVSLDGMLSDANWIRAFGIPVGGAGYDAVIQRLVDAHAEIVRLRARL